MFFSGYRFRGVSRKGDFDAQAGIGVAGLDTAVVDGDGTLGNGETKTDTASAIAVAVGLDAVEGLE